MLSAAWFEENAIWMIALLGTALLISIVIGAFGKKLSNSVHWVCWVSLGVLGAVALLGAGAFSTKDILPQILERGWIWPRSQVGALRVGMYFGLTGFVMAFLAAAMSLVATIVHQRIPGGQKTEKLYSAAILGSLGVFLSWCSFTAWLSFIGIGLAILGAILSFASDWESAGGADEVARFGFERVAALLIALVGAVILSSRGVSLEWTQPSPSWESSSPILLGSWLLVVGLFLELQNFPVRAASASRSGQTAVAELLVRHVLIGWSSLSIIFRLEPQLRAAGVFPAFGWVALAVSFLSASSGFLNEDWKPSIRIWVSSAFALSFAGFSFAGQPAGLTLLVAAGLAAITFVTAAAGLELGGSSSDSHRNRARGLKIAVVIAAAIASGMLCFVSAGGMVRLFASALSNTALAVFCGLSVFVLFLLAWKNTWVISSVKNATEVSWVVPALSFVPVLLALGIFWWGGPVGGAIAGNPDGVLSWGMTDFLNANAPAESDLLTGLWLECGVLIVAFFLALWVARGAKTRIQTFNRAYEGFSSFVRGGYGLETLVRGLRIGLLWVGRNLTEHLDFRLSTEALPATSGRALHFFGRAVSRVDAGASDGLDLFTRKVTDVSSKWLQLIQNGNLQWYLIFAIGAGLAMLLHFLKFA